ncbi:MAG: epoxyqueuosine reductase [Endomicrobiales bacterium]|nr:epoxyqueuosine reductase [Endomicrobiales bacterium]
MDAKNNYDALNDVSIKEGMALFGVADIKETRSKFLISPEVSSKFDYAISIGYRLSKSILDTLTDSPNQIYYFHYQRINVLLDQTTLKLSTLIQNKGFNAFPIPASQVIDWEKQLGSVSHREIARLAGHGWYGRNNLLVNPKYGSQVRYASILTNLPLLTDNPIKDNCKECRACISVCPANAIGENDFNLEACHLKLKEFIKTKKIGQMICGICIKVCPGKKNL